VNRPSRVRLALVGGAASIALAGASLVSSPAFADPFFVYPDDPSPVAISKTWSAGPVGNGGTATATLSAHNPTGTPAHVIIQDTYDHGLVPDLSGLGGYPCGTTSYSGYPMFYCHLTVAPGDTESVDVPFTVSYAGPKVYTKNWKTNERVTVQKAEANWNNFAGQQTFHSISCPAGYVMIDHALRKQHVDQGAGTLEDVRVVTSNLTSSEWQVTLKNNTTGQAQGKLWAACLKQDTNQGGSFAVSGVRSHSVDNFHPVGDAESQFIAWCDPGEIPIAVNLRAVPANGNYSPYQDALVSQVGLYANGGPSTVLFAKVHEPADTTLQWRCLLTTSSTGYRMHFSQVQKHTTVAPGQEVDVDVSCADDEKGIVGGWHGGKLNGQEPRPKIRTYWYRNTSGAQVDYTATLLCVGNRLVKGGKVAKNHTDPRCNYLGGVHEVAPGDELWLNDDEQCIDVKQGA
jgi:hypothetical protein